MKKGLMLVIAAAFLIASIPVFADYNKDATVKAMRENYAGLTAAKTAAESADFYSAADGLIVIAKNALLLASMDPPKGSKDEWKAAQQALAKAAFKAIGACGSENKVVLDAALAEIVSAQKKGHASFKG